MKRTTVWEDVGTGTIYVALGLCAIITLLPFVYIVAGSFATERELVERPFFIIPRYFSLNAYKYIIETGEIFNGLKNSLFITIVGTFSTLFFTTTFAYPLSKRNFKGRNVILNFVIVTMLFSGGLIPTFLLVKSLGLYNSYASIILLGAISPFNMIIVKNFFKNIPDELEEAAIIDGYSDLGVFVKIVLPLSKPVLASIGLFTAVGFWNDYFNAMIYLQDSFKETAQVVLRRIVLLSESMDAEVLFAVETPPDKAVRMAATVVATVPILVVYPFLQKHFAQGVMVGAVKG